MVAILSFSFINAYLYACFEKGDAIDFCHPATPDRTCTLNMGCTYCMSSYNATRNCWNQGNLNGCNQLENQTCSYGGNGSGGGGGIDAQAPNITLTNPVSDGIYNKRVIPVILTVTERSDVYYYDNLNGRSLWTKVCLDCISYSGNRNFKEGLNDLTFRATDSDGNEATKNVIFTVDSIKPKINKIEPTRGFASGDFHVEFTEANPTSLILYYGDNNRAVNINSECQLDRNRYVCDFNVDLSSFNGQSVSYYFVLTDVASTVAISKTYTLGVDTTAPVVNNPDSFWRRDGRNVYFNISITEPNFDSVEYYDNSASRPRWMNLCSRLRDGNCVVKKSLARGEHDLSIQVTDKAGNAIALGTGAFEVL